MNHKRHRPKHQRAGCLMCKPHKDERRATVAKPSDERRMQPDGDDEDTWYGCDCGSDCFVCFYWDSEEVTTPPLTHRLPL